MVKTDWSIQNLWNSQLVGDQWPIKPRNYIRASEMGYSMLDRYYKMSGEKFSNDFDTRLLRVFQMGNLLEWVVGIVFKKAGIFISTQDEIKIKGEGQNLDVVGHLDFIAGGKPDWDKAQKIIKGEDLPISFKNVSEAIIKELKKKFPNGLKEMVYEVKSINSMVFWKHQKAGEGQWKGYPHHQLQTYTYMKGAGIDEGRILYVSKDDLTLAEIAVVADDDLEKRFQEDVLTISKHYIIKTAPDKEPDLLFDEKKRKYEANWKLGRSNYLTKITGLEKEDWEKQFRNLANRCNSRIKKALVKFPNVDDEQLKRVLAPYIDAEIQSIYSGKLVIKKDVNYD